jgi:hypothetical protein
MASILLYIDTRIASPFPADVTQSNSEVMLKHLLRTDTTTMIRIGRSCTGASTPFYGAAILASAGMVLRKEIKYY